MRLREMLVVCFSLLSLAMKTATPFFPLDGLTFPSFPSPGDQNNLLVRVEGRLPPLDEVDSPL